PHQRWDRRTDLRAGTQLLLPGREARVRGHADPLVETDGAGFGSRVDMEVAAALSASGERTEHVAQEHLSDPTPPVPAADAEDLCVAAPGILFRRGDRHDVAGHLGARPGDEAERRIEPVAGEQVVAEALERLLAGAPRVGKRLAVGLEDGSRI